MQEHAPNAALSHITYSLFEKIPWTRPGSLLESARACLGVKLIKIILLILCEPILSTDHLPGLPFSANC